MKLSLHIIPILFFSQITFASCPQDYYDCIIANSADECESVRTSCSEPTLYQYGPFGNGTYSVPETHVDRQAGGFSYQRDRYGAEGNVSVQGPFGGTYDRARGPGHKDAYGSAGGVTYERHREGLNAETTVTGPFGGSWNRQRGPGYKDVQTTYPGGTTVNRGWGIR